jgi:hypothetical protein
MKTNVKLIVKLLAASAVFVSTTTATSSAQAFSTGNHFIATDRGLTRAGFDNDAILHVQAANYNVDHHFNLVDEVMPASGLMQRGKNVSMFFHADDLHTRPEVERDLIAMDRWVRAVVLEAKPKRDHRAILNAIGFTLHALQDFYSHSNFADFDWVAWKGARVVTMEDVPRDIWENPLFTGRWSKPDDSKGLFSGWSTSKVHGGKPGYDPNYPGHESAWKECHAGVSAKECGLNHDGARRRNSLLAVLMAAEATYDFAERVRLLVGDAALWNKIQHPGGDIATALEWNRAQALSTAGGQWGAEHEESKLKVVVAWATTHCTLLAAIQCPWEDKWRDNFFTAFQSAPTGHAQSGGGEMFPAASVPELPLPATNPVVPAVYAGVYTVTWGMKKGVLTINPVANNKMAGELVVENDGPANAPSNNGAPVPGTGSRTYRQTALWMRNGALELSLRTPDDRFGVSGVVYMTASATTRDLAGYLRDSVDGGTPDGFAAVRRSGGAGPGPNNGNTNGPIGPGPVIRK